MTDTTELVARLRDQQNMIQLGEDAYEAADAIERLTRERDEAWETGYGVSAQLEHAEFHRAAAEARIAELTCERDEATRWTVRFETDLNRTMLALGDRFTLAIPDGGDVHPHEAAKAAIDALAAAEARIAKLEAALRSVEVEAVDLERRCSRLGHDRLSDQAEAIAAIARAALEDKP